jgi:hypothetical protein
VPTWPSSTTPGGNYPGDVINVVHAVAGNKVLVAWPSRYCASGQPNYSLDNEQNLPRRTAIAEYLGLDLETPAPENLYLLDMYKVAGQQQSVDYSDAPVGAEPRGGRGALLLPVDLPRGARQGRRPTHRERRRDLHALVQAGAA